MASRGGSGILGAGGGFGSGLLLLVGGLLVKHAEANEVALCSSGFGRFGQALDPNVASSCSLAQDLSNGATAAIWIGAIVLAIAGISLIASLAGLGAMAAKSRNAKTAHPPARAGTRPAMLPDPRAAAGNAASFPAVSWDPPQDSTAPTPPQSATPRRLLCSQPDSSRRSRTAPRPSPPGYSRSGRGPFDLPPGRKSRSGRRGMDAATRRGRGRDSVPFAGAQWQTAVLPATSQCNSTGRLPP